MSILKNQAITAIVKIIVAILLGLFVLMVGAFIMSLDGLPELIRSNHTTMLFLSLLIILILSKGRISSYGFKLTRDIRLKQITLWSFGIAVVGTLLQAFIPGKGLTFLEGFSFPRVVIFIWIYASICEEVLTRGLIQGYLKPLVKYGFTIFKPRISLPVLVGALFFGSMHLALLTMGVGSFMVFTIVLLAFILGIIAGYYREKTGSIIPAIITHMVFNISGTLIGFLTEPFGG